MIEVSCVKQKHRGEREGSDVVVEHRLSTLLSTFYDWKKEPKLSSMLENAYQTKGPVTLNRTG
jgi:hypothetical protein